MSPFHSSPSCCEELLRAIVGGTTDRVAVIDTDYRFIGFNEAYRADFAARFGRAPQLNESFLDLVQDRDCALATFGPALRGESYTVEEGIGFGAERCWYEIEVYPLRNGAEVVGVAHIARDITSRKSAQRELRNFNEELERQVADRTAAVRANEALVHRVLDSLLASVGVLRPDGTLIDVNRVPLQLSGIQADDVIGRKFWDCMWWSDSDEASRRVRDECGRVAQGETFRYDTSARVAKDGRLMIDYMIAPLRDDAGQVTHLVASAVDITERVRLAATAEAQRAQLQAIIDRIVQGIVIFNADGSVRTMNPAALALHGFATLADMYRQIDGYSDEFIAQFPDGRPMSAVDWPVARSLCGETVRDFEMHARNRRTDETWVAIYNSVPMLDAAGAIESVVVTIQDITERKRTESMLLGADRRKDEFIATLAHELRNPLAPILSSIQLLQLDGDVDVTRQRAKDIIERQVQQMARLIDDLLDISRITLGKLALRRERVELKRIVEEASELARPHIVALEHHFSVTLPDRPVLLVGDGTRLAQVLSNLLINAAKYTPRQGIVALLVEVDGDSAIVRVRDSGIGIAPEHVPALFEKFSQVRSTQDRTGGGLGIGLALAKGLVHMHGGTIAASSPGPGAGSEFVIRLPIATGDALPKPSLPAMRHLVSGLRVLVADDNEDAVESAAMVLAINGNDVQLASDGLEAVEAAGRYRPDVVLLDIGMPKLNGFEACRRIRAEPWGKDMLLVAVTGWGQEEDRRRTAEAGFDAHFTKPVDFASVMALITQRRAARTH